MLSSALSRFTVFQRVLFAVLVVAAIAAFTTARPNGRREHRRQAELRPRLAVDRREGRQAPLRHLGHPAVVRERRPVLVHLPDPRRPQVLPRRAGQEVEGAAVRPRQDGGHAHADDRPAVRDGAPAVQHREVREEGGGVPVRHHCSAQPHDQRQADREAEDDDGADRRCDRPGQRRGHGSPERRPTTAAATDAATDSGQTRGSAASGATRRRANAARALPPRRRRRATGRCGSSTTWPPARST